MPFSGGYKSGHLPWLVASFGDSRASLDYTGTLQNGGNSPLNVACALADQRYRMAGQNFGVSGKRTDEYIASQLAGVLASKAGIIHIIGALNDIGQDIPTQTTSGATAAANVQAAATTIINSGRVVIIEAELGQDSIASVRLGQVYEYNQRMREWCERTSGAYWHDARPVLLNATSSTSTQAFKTNYSYDGTHPSQLGGYYWGKSLKLLLDSITPTRQSLLNNISELPANGRWQLLDNPLFNVTTGGSTSTGVTGTFPGSCTINKTGSITVASTAASQNEQLAIAFAAQSDNARIAMTANNANWQAGDWVQGICKAIITNPSGLSVTQLTLVPQVDGANQANISDMTATASMAGPDETHSFTYMTDPYQIKPYTTQNFLALTFYAVGFGAGSSFNINILQMGIIRRLAAYGG